ncbi:AarF/UbiB family protein [Nonomuraea rosea]|uniref:AarF/UbiB family protein n=2 Tax=Nonomuraea rosea TaxID=638574 RepID=A0ABP6X7I6_9ACTN
MPQYAIDELEHLNDQANVAPFSMFEPVLEDELGAGWRSRFRAVHTDQPLGSASLAQVYKAIWADGTPCVIKVQRPGSEAAVRGDMAVLRKAAWLIAKTAPRFCEVVDVQAMLETLFTVMDAELDFTREARNMKRARKNAKQFKRLRIPKVLEATPRVLVQTFADGVPINRIKSGDLTRKQRKEIAHQLMGYMFRGYFVDRFFHADPHPGNIIISPDGKAHLIDWGMLGRLDRGSSLAVLTCLLGITRSDGAALARGWARLGTATPWSNMSAFVGDVSRIVPHWADASLAELNYGVALMTLMRYSSERGIQISPLVSVLGKSLANMEGSVRYIYPKLKLDTALQSILQDIMRELLLDNLDVRQSSQVLLECLAAVNGAPAQLQAFLSDLADRQFAVQARTNLGDPIGPGKRHRLSLHGNRIRAAAALVAAGVVLRRLQRRATRSTE